LNEHSSLQVRPVTPGRWHDLEKLFGERGACQGCWCMYFRLRSSQAARNTGSDNKRALKNLVQANTVPGLLAYSGRELIAWVSLAPREQFAHLEHSRKLVRIDDAPVWSIVCFFVAKDYRGKGMMAPLLRAAIEYASKRGAKIVEAYPVDAKNRELTGYHGFTGIASTFRRIGFRKVKSVSPYQAIMRFEIT
jgi:GNAT superfamily N-acetyltransferase